MLTDRPDPELLQESLPYFTSGVSYRTKPTSRKETGMKRNAYAGAIFLVVLGVLALANYLLEQRVAVEAADVMAPRFEVDPLWPQPLPNHWLLGQTIGVSVDAQDHIWIIHRG